MWYFQTMDTTEKSASIKGSFASSIFKKIIMAVTGLALVGFVVAHLLGNLLLYAPDGSIFNQYAYKLHSLGFLLYVAEAGLIAFFLFHAVTGIRLALSAKKAKPQNYLSPKSKGGESKWGFASNNMVITGTILLVFVILHVKHFKFGPDIVDGYSTQINGTEARDLYRHVVEQFKNPLIVALYVAAMTFLGFHLKHGIWSALQSLGLTRDNNNKKLYIAGTITGVLLAVGFLLIPVYIFLFKEI